jgi:uridine phosphorylase
VPFPVRPRKHAQPAVFRAEHFIAYLEQRGERPDPAPRTVVVAFSPRAVDRTVERWAARPVRGMPRLFSIGRGARAIGLVEPRGIGAPALSVTVEELAVLGARRFVAVGYAGAVRADLPAGSYVLCTRALRDEGTSYHYTRPSRWARPSPGLTRSLAQALEGGKAPFRRGPSWTIDAPYRETVEELRSVRRAGVLTVEMEASALFAIARVRHLEAAAVFAISDHLDEHGWTPRFREARPSLEHLLDLVIGSLGTAATPRTAFRRRARTRAGGKAQ